MLTWANLFYFFMTVLYTSVSAVSKIWHEIDVAYDKKTYSSNRPHISQSLWSLGPLTLKNWWPLLKIGWPYISVSYNFYKSILLLKVIKLKFWWKEFVIIVEGILYMLITSIGNDIQLINIVLFACFIGLLKFLLLYLLYYW